MDFDEDDDVLLEGGQLYQHLKQVTDESFSVYNEDDPNLPTYNDPVMSSSVNEKIFISEETKNIIDLLLLSSVMLEEDAKYLHVSSQKFKICHERLYLKTILSVTSCIVTGCANFILRSRKCSLPIWISCTGLSMYFIRRMRSYRNLNKHVKQLCVNVNQTIAVLNRHFQLMRANIICISTKKMYSAQKFPSSIMDERYKWAGQQIFFSSMQLAVCLLGFVNFTRSSYKELIQIFKKPSKKSHLLLENQDHELGLTNIRKDCQNGKISLATLDILKHINILIQSEFIRLLGCYLFEIESTTQRQRVCSVLKKYNKYFSSFINMGNRRAQYNDINYSSTAYLLKEKLQPHKESIMTEMQIMRMHLHSLIVEIADIEDIIIGNNISEDSNKNIILNGLNTVQDEVQGMTFTIDKIKKQLIKESKSAPIQKTTEFKNIKYEPKEIIDVIDNESDKRPKDEVFLGISESNVTSEMSEYEENVSNKMLTMTYNKVVSEIKVAIEPKRLEFEERESIALQRNPDYKLILELEQEKNENAPQALTDEGGDKSIELSSEKALFFKGLAAKAVMRSHEWGHDCGDVDFE